MFRNKVIIFFVFFILLQSVCLGTNIDSLLQLLESSRGIRKAELFNDLSETYLNTSAEKSIKHAIEALEMSEDLNSFTERGRAYKNIGNAYNLLNVNELAILNYGKALGIYENLNNKENIADVLFQMATVYYKISDYSNALSLVKQSLLIYEELNDSLKISNSYNTIGVIYWKLSDLDKALENYLKSLLFDDEEIHNTFNNIGIIYGIQGNYDKALEYQLKALEIRREIGLMNGIAGSLNNIGIIYKFMNKLDTALNYFIEALEIWGEIGQPWRLASIMNNVGSIYLAKGDYTEALDYFRKSLIYSDEAENVNEYANTLLNLGDVYLELQKYDSSLIFLQEGIILADRIQARNLMRDGYFLLHELYYQRGEYNNALEYYKEYSVVKDSIFSKQSKDKIAELRIKYETEEKEKENELLRQNNSIQTLKLSREKNIRNLFLVILLLIAILIFLFFNRYTTRKKTNKILTDKNIQINRINQDLRKLNKELEIRVKERTKNFEDEIQERKQAEKIQRVLFKIARAANTAMVLKDLLKVIQQEVSNILDMRNFFIVLYDREKDQLTLPYFVDEKDKFISFPEGKTLTSYVIRKKTMVLLRQDDIQQLVKSGEIEQVGSMCKVWLGVPLRSESQIIGVFVIQNYEDENAFNKNDIKILEFIADQIGTMIERKSTEEKINIAKEKAEESDRLKTSFLTNMSHEIRTPMNAIIGFSNLLLKPDISQSKKSEYVEIISNNTSALLKIIDDVIDTARIEVGEIRIEDEDCQINKILDEQLIFNKEMKVKINKQHIELRVRKGVENDNFTIRTDPYRIRQILANLISNAIKFVEEGYVEFGYEVKNEKLQFYVKDTGIGIPDDKQKVIFDRFRQAEESYTRKYGGTGLGLTICKNLVGMLGGEIWLESKVGEGSTFFFTVSLKQVYVTEEIDSIDVELPVRWDWKDKRILVAEDVDSNFELVKELLEKTAAKIIWVKNGREAIETCKNDGGIDLILMDISMPELDGLAATIEIKKFQRELPIIAITAFAKAEEKEKFLKLGCDDYISKPIDEEVLMKAIARQLG